MKSRFLFFASLLTVSFLPSLRADNHEPTPFKEYAGLLGKDLAGSVFLIKYNNSLAAVMSRHQFGENVVPDLAEDITGEETIELDSSRAVFQDDIQIIPVKNQDLDIPWLEYRSNYRIQKNEKLWIRRGETLGDSDGTSGYLAEQNLDGVFFSPRDKPTELVMKLSGTADVRGASGSPVFSEKTGTPVGVLLAADDGENASFVVFEPICLPVVAETEAEKLKQMQAPGKLQYFESLAAESEGKEAVDDIVSKSFLHVDYHKTGRIAGQRRAELLAEAESKGLLPDDDNRIAFYNGVMSMFRSIQSPQPFPEQWKAATSAMSKYVSHQRTHYPPARLFFDENRELQVERNSDHHRGTNFFKNGIASLSRGRLGGKSPYTKYAANYAAILSAHDKKNYFFSSNPVYYSVEGTADSGFTVHESNAPKDVERFPNQWYFDTASYFSFLNGTRFDSTDPNPLETHVTLTISPEDGIVSRTLLPIDHEHHLEWLIYKNGELWKSITKKPVTKVQLTTEATEQVPSVFMVLVVARSGRSRLLVSPVAEFVHIENDWIPLPRYSLSNRDPIRMEEIGF